MKLDKNLDKICYSIRPVAETIDEQPKELMMIDKIKEQVLEKSTTCGRRSGNLSVREIFEILDVCSNEKQQTISELKQGGNNDN